MFGSFSDDLLEQFKRDYAERQAFAIGYPQQSYTDKEDMPCNKPKAEAHGDKSHVVKSCHDGKQELIRFGQKGVKGSPAHEGESDESKARRASFMARHKKNIDKGPSSAAYWAAKVKW